MATELEARARIAPRRVLVAALAVLLLAAACMTDDQRTAFELVNRSRANNDLPGLLRSVEAQDWAQDWANHLADQGSLSHSNLQRFLDDAGGVAAAENVGYGGSIWSIHSEYMDSPDHRANILGDYSHLGVGVARDGNRYYTVQVFLLR